MSVAHDSIVKCIILGNKGVGKTTIVSKIMSTYNVNNHFQFNERETKSDEDKSIEETIGIEYSVMSVKAPNDAVVKFQIWDGSGNEIYKDIVLRYCEGIQIVCLVFDLNDVTSLNNVVEWHKLLKEKWNISCDNAIIIMIGNKLDLLADVKVNKKIFSKGIEEKDTASWNALEHHCITEKAEGIAKFMGAYYAEISAKTGQNIKTLHSTMTNLSVNFFNIKPKFINNPYKPKHPITRRNPQDVVQSEEDDGVSEKAKCTGECIVC